MSTDNTAEYLIMQAREHLTAATDELMTSPSPKVALTRLMMAVDYLIELEEKRLAAPPAPNPHRNGNGNTRNAT
jgi:hypothetical protein